MRAQIEDFCQQMLPHCSVPFEPHVTIVGGFQCETILEMNDVVSRLQKDLRGSGQVRVVLGSKPESENRWNQALYLPVIDPSDEFMNLCRMTRGVLGMNTVDWTFPFPAERPHLSVYYGEESVPDEKKSVSTNGCDHFVAVKAAVWKTDPSSVEGVAQWEELAVIDLA